MYVAWERDEPGRDRVQVHGTNGGSRGVSWGMLDMESKEEWSASNATSKGHTSYKCTWQSKGQGVVEVARVDELAKDRERGQMCATHVTRQGTLGGTAVVTEVQCHLLYGHQPHSQ